MVDVTLTDAEKHYCSLIADRVVRLREFLAEASLAQPPDPVAWHTFLSTLRQIQGNTSNDASFVATLLAKQFLCARFPLSFDAAAKPQGAPGIDIDVTADDGARIVAEIKTTVPYKGTDFGAMQAQSFRKDFLKLVNTVADHKFLFVTDHAAFTALRKEKYTKMMPGVRIVDLVSGNEHAA